MKWDCNRLVYDINKTNDQNQNSYKYFNYIFSKSKTF